MPRRYKRTYKRRYKRRTYKRSNRVAYKALKIARSMNRKIAAEVCKFEATPDTFANYSLSVGTSSYAATQQYPLQVIESGKPYIYPLNWYYTAGSNLTSMNSVYINGQQYTYPATLPGSTVSTKFPIWYNTLGSPTTDSNDSISTELQYRLKYIYINAIFNASNLDQSNPDGALRIIVVKDKQPTAGAPDWFANETQQTTLFSRSVFNSNNINAQLNPKSVGRFSIMYDKTLRFSTINGYKPFKYFKKISSVVRNNTQLAGIPQGLSTSTSFYQTSETPAPILKNAYYLMIFSDGLKFTHSNQSSTPAQGFTLFSRVAYYNN